MQPMAGADTQAENLRPMKSRNFSDRICVSWLRPGSHGVNEARSVLEPDAQLVQSCLRGDGSAWEALVKRHTRRVYNLCYRFTGNSAAAEDLSQEVFLRVYRTIESYRPEQGAFPTWLTSVTRNLLVDHYRRSRRDRLTDSMDDASSQVEAKQASGDSPERLAHAAELSDNSNRPSRDCHPSFGVTMPEGEFANGNTRASVDVGIHAVLDNPARLLQQDVDCPSGELFWCWAHE